MSDRLWHHDFCGLLLVRAHARVRRRSSFAALAPDDDNPKTAAAICGRASRRARSCQRGGLRMMTRSFETGLLVSVLTALGAGCAPADDGPLGSSTLGEDTISGNNQVQNRMAAEARKRAERRIGRRI